MAVFVVVLNYRSNRIKTALYSDDNVSSLGIGIGVNVGVGNATRIHLGRHPCRQIRSRKRGREGPILAKQ